MLLYENAKLFLGFCKTSHIVRIYVTPLPFLQHSPFIEFCNQIVLGVFQILKAKTNQNTHSQTLMQSLWI